VPVTRSFSKPEWHVIQNLQGSIPLDTFHPYEQIALRCGMNEDELLTLLRRWEEEGIVRRVAALLRHQMVGALHNALSVWAVPTEAKTRIVAEALCAYREVSHCYERPPAPGWPYNLYGMLHCPSRERCMEIIDEVARYSGVHDYRVLPSLREYKKKSPVYLPAGEPDKRGSA
jgi:DNA-binding Lrp family transcriptional regulator